MYKRMPVLELLISWKAYMIVPHELNVTRMNCTKDNQDLNYTFVVFKGPA